MTVYVIPFGATAHGASEVTSGPPLRAGTSGGVSATPLQTCGNAPEIWEILTDAAHTFTFGGQVMTVPSGYSACKGVTIGMTLVVTA